MNTFTVVFLCIQACLVQNVFGQCTSRAAVVAEPGLIAPGIGALASPLAYEGLAGWRGIGPAAAAIAPGLAAPYGLASPLAYDGLAGPYGLAAAAGPFGYRAGLGELAYPGGLAFADEIEAIAPYGGAGEGNVAVAGELPVAGTTAVAGQVPIMGAVKFGGPVAAAGSVTITGQCECGRIEEVVPAYYL